MFKKASWSVLAALLLSSAKGGEAVQTDLDQGSKFNGTAVVKDDETVPPQVDQAPHPTVQANANSVKLSAYDHDYYGKLFVGSKYEEQQMIYDTMQDRTLILVKEAGGNCDVPCNYSPSDSDSAKPISADGNSLPINEDLQYGKTVLKGSLYQDNVCLYQPTNDRSESTGRICARQLDFVAVNEVFGSFSANGIVGLAPSMKSPSIVSKLWAQDQMQDNIIGLNYENPDDTSSISTIHVGYYDYNEVKGGEEGVNFYDNMGEGRWALLLDDLQYDGEFVQANFGGKLALIDSGNTSIQLPTTQFNIVKQRLQKHDKTIYEQEVDDQKILVSRKNCNELVDVLGDIQFVLSGTQIIIHPKGYIYSQASSQTDCFIGISEIPDEYNQYRLGTIFLRNFYTGLDFEDQQIMLGINEGIDTAQMIGKRESKAKRRGGAGLSLLFVTFFLLTLLVIAAVCYCRNRQIKDEEDNEVTFQSGESRKKYRNGVEVKPSEVKGGRRNAGGSSTAINDDNNETLLDADEA